MLRTCYAHAMHMHMQVALSVLLVHPKLGGMGYLGMAAARSWYATQGAPTLDEQNPSLAEP